MGSDNDRSVKTNKSYMRMPKGGNFFLKGTCTFIMVLFCQLKGEREVPETQTSESCDSTLLRSSRRAKVSTWGNPEV